MKSISKLIRTKLSHRIVQTLRMRQYGIFSISLSVDMERELWDKVHDASTGQVRSLLTNPLRSL